MDLQFDLPKYTVLKKGATAIMIHSINKKMIIFRTGYCNSQERIITMDTPTPGEYYIRKVFITEDGMRFYVKMGGVYKLYFDNFERPDDDYTIINYSG